MSHSIQPECGAQGRARKVAGSGSISTSAAPSSSFMPNPAPGCQTGNTVRCEVSFSSMVAEKPTPFFSAASISPAAKVLPRSTPCWSAKASRTTDISPARMRRSASRVAVLRSSVQRPARSTRVMLGSRHQRRASVRRPARILAAALVEFLPIRFPADGRSHAVDGRGAANGSRTHRVEAHRRLLAVAHLADGRQQQAAIGNDRLVAVPQMLARAVLDPALAFDRPLIVDVDVEAHAGEGLGLLFGDIVAIVVLPTDARPVVGQLIEFKPLLAHLLVIDRLSEAGEDRVPVAGGVV